MMTFYPPAETIIFETSHWLVNHRVDTTMPGYLIVGAKVGADWNELSTEALAELGSVLAQSVQAITDCLHPQRVYISRYGHTPGHSLHFHLIPVYDWLIEAYQQDERYRVLEQFYTPGSVTGLDGASLTLFIWREYAEKKGLPPDGISIVDVICQLRQTIGECPASEGE